MFSITKEYESDSIGRESRGRWLYRGYNVGGNLVGRWRDTHTPQDLNGYEGTFLVSSSPVPKLQRATFAEPSRR